MIHAIVMAGGKGTRFWPLSRAVKAKQFLEIIGDQTLLEHTLKRTQPVCDRLWIVGNTKQTAYFKHIPSAMTPYRILYEPVGRNTAPCIGWAAIEVLRQDPDGIMIVVPSDHMIQNVERFQSILKTAVDLVEKQDCLVTLGITAKSPHTGYGYIEAKDIKNGIGQVVRFREKPNYETAVNFIKKGRFFWNAGIFVWRAQTILDMLKKHLPEDAPLFDALAECDPNNHLKIKGIFRRLQSISIDYAVMEHEATRIRLIPSDIGWDDIGNWSSLRNHWSTDENGNTHKGELITVDARNNIVYSPKKLVGLVNVEGLVIVETKDAILVLPADSDQKIRELYDRLPERFK
ncbi:mannose-1-phosphate guanylyltransferase [bacterium]|nr:mannose-1-phosphate guanylyltransferase [bacterium]